MDKLGIRKGRLDVVDPTEREHNTKELEDREEEAPQRLQQSAELVEADRQEVADLF